MTISKAFFDQHVRPRLGRGYVFRGQYPPGSPYHHLCVIVNQTIIDGSTIFYVVMTSEVDKLKRIMKNDKLALAELDKSEYDEYKDHFKALKPTCVRCDLKSLYETL